MRGEKEERRKRISKLMAYILRHNPAEFGVELDERGFASLSDLLRGLRKVFPDVTRTEVEEIVREDPKGRYELRGERIRALYGHSIPARLDAEPVRPPERLFHGTSRRSVGSILKEGLKPMGRRFVHLSLSREDAFAVGRRHDSSPAILEIKALEAWNAGIPFYHPAESIFLAPYIPPQFIALGEGRSGCHRREGDEGIEEIRNSSDIIRREKGN